jgi:hypothetical protein
LHQNQVEIQSKTIVSQKSSDKESKSKYSKEIEESQTESNYEEGLIKIMKSFIGGVKKD